MVDNAFIVLKGECKTPQGQYDHSRQIVSRLPSFGDQLGIITCHTL